MVCELPPHFLEGAPLVREHVPSGSVLQYVRRHEHAPYEPSPDWYDYPRYGPRISLPLVRTLQQEAPWYRRLIERR